MKKIQKKTILLGIPGLLISLYFILYFSKSYDFLILSHKNYEKIFNNTFYDSIIVNSAFCNEIDTIYNLKFDNYRITAWKLSRYKNILAKNINLDFNHKNRDFYFTVYSEVEVNPLLNIRYKITDNISQYMTFNVSRESEIFDTLNYKNNKGYYFRTSKFGIGDLKKRSNIIFDFGRESREVILLFLNSENQNYLLVFYPYLDEKINDDLFLRMLN